MLNKILIIGAGQLGSRHLQGVLKVNSLLNVFVVDPSEVSLNIAKERANEIQHSHNLFFSNSIDNSIKEYDIAIIATNANVREQIIKKLLEEVRISYMILEKVLFQNIEAYSAIEDLISQKNVKTWVNHPRRMFPTYQKIKQHLSENNQEKIYVAITGYDWGIGCNGLHFIDLVCFLKNTSVEKIHTDLLDQKIQKSKRDGFIEFTGTLTVKFTCGSILVLTSFEGSQLPTDIVIQSKNFKWLIKEGNEIQIIQQNQSVEIESISPLFQSDLTTQLINSILETKTCELTNFTEAKLQHIAFIQILLNFQQTLTGLKNVQLNIT